MDNTAVLNRKSYDLWGIALSTICGIHCLITPIAILYFPSLAEHIKSSWTHTLLIGLVAVMFYQSVYLHYKVHRSKTALRLGLLGFVLLLIPYFFEVLHHSHEHHSHGNGHSKESLLLYLAIAGSLLMITSHIMNLRKCRCLRGNGPCLDDTDSN